jgi:hypothetical protein
LVVTFLNYILPDALQVVITLISGWLFVKIWLFVIAIDWGPGFFWLMAAVGIPVAIFLIYHLWIVFIRGLILRISMLPLKLKIAWMSARRIRGPKIKREKLQQMSKAIRNRFFHGTSLQAAIDILKNNRVRLGIQDSFWVADLFSYAQNHSRGRGYGKIGIVEFRLANGYQLNIKGGNRYTATIPWADRNKFYRFRSLIPVAVYDVNGNLIAKRR